MGKKGKMQIPEKDPVLSIGASLRRAVFHLSEWLSSKSLQIPNAGEGVEKREPSYAVGGNVNWCSHCGKQYGDFSKN